MSERRKIDPRAVDLVGKLWGTGDEGVRNAADIARKMEEAGIPNPYGRPDWSAYHVHMALDEWQRRGDS